MRLLIYQPALKRIEAEIAPIRDRLELLVVGRDGEITCGSQSFDADTAQPEAGWFSADAMGGAAQRTVMTGLLKSERLAWVHTGAAGVDHPIWAQLVDKGAVLTTGHGQALCIAEYVLAELLGHFQRLGERRAEQAARRWTRLPFREIAGTSWLVIGFGAIGQAVAQRAKGFGASIVGVRRSGAPDPLADRMGSLGDVKALLPASDVVVLATPLNPQTRNMADAGFFAAMKPGSVLVNVGRGDLVDEIGAAGLRAVREDDDLEPERDRAAHDVEEMRLDGRLAAEQRHAPVARRGRVLERAVELLHPEERRLAARREEAAHAEDAAVVAEMAEL